MSNSDAAPAATRNSDSFSNRLNFTIERRSTNSKARAARFRTLHGVVETPIFMPVGTQATVKAQTAESLHASGTRVLLANTYHLLLRPGPRVFQAFGGIHRFMNWDGPVLTDSGGFQIFSLPHARDLSEEGARFQSYVDGRSYLLSPESTIDTQKAIGSDIMMALDQCIPSTAPYDQARTAMELTHRWAERSLCARGDSPQALFGIVQGACHHDLRKRSAAFLSGLPFDGLAIGGLAVGECRLERYEITGLVTDHLPPTLPRYLMGVGTPLDILECVHLGVDMFDCIIPSQLAQRGIAFTSHGKLQLRRSVYKFAAQPVDASCTCATCRQYSRAYLHHLVKSDEYLGWHLLGVHNLTFFHGLMRELRAAILRDDFSTYYEAKRVELARIDEDNPVRPPRAPHHRPLPRLGDYQIYGSPRGFFSIRQISSGEVMHSVTPPSDEANRLYIDQSALVSRLLRRDTEEDLQIWDVGLGAASNAMAVVSCFERCYAQYGGNELRPLCIVSFEWDLDPLTLAADHVACFPHLRHSAPFKILSTGHWQHSSGLLRWELRRGDFRDLMATASVPDLIFYDPFSYKTEPALWTAEVFSRIYRCCTPKPAELYTYSAATAARVALLTAGFFVATGVGTGPKTETTIAFTAAQGLIHHPLAPRPLDQQWLLRWRRSGAKFPAHLTDEEKRECEKLIEGHLQFSAGFPK